MVAATGDVPFERLRVVIGGDRWLQMYRFEVAMSHVISLGAIMLWNRALTPVMGGAPFEAVTRAMYMV